MYASWHTFDQWSSSRVELRVFSACARSEPCRWAAIADVGRRVEVIPLAALGAGNQAFKVSGCEGAASARLEHSVHGGDELVRLGIVLDHFGADDQIETTATGIENLRVGASSVMDGVSTHLQALSCVV